MIQPRQVPPFILWTSSVGPPQEDSVIVRPQDLDQGLVANPRPALPFFETHRGTTFQLGEFQVDEAARSRFMANMARLLCQSADEAIGVALESPAAPSSDTQLPPDSPRLERSSGAYLMSALETADDNDSDSDNDDDLVSEYAPVLSSVREGDNHAHLTDETGYEIMTVLSK